MATPAPSEQELFDLGLAEAKARRPDLTVGAGDVSEMEIAAGSAMGDAVVGYSAGRFRDTFLDTAEGDALTEWCLDRYGVRRNDAVEATAQVTFKRTVNGPAGTLAAGFVVATEKDALGVEIQFMLQRDQDWALNEQAEKVADLIAVVPGRASNITSTGKITRIVSSIFDSNIIIKPGSSTTATGGDDEEKDPDLRERARAKPLTFRRGTLDAIEYGALQVKGVKRAKVYEDSTGILSLYIAGIDGNASAQMVSAVTEEMRNWRGGGALLNVLAGTLLNTPIKIVLTVRAGTAIAPLVANIKAAVVALLEKLRPGETLYVDTIRATVLAIDPLNILQADIRNPDDSPFTNLSPLSSSQSIRTTVNDLTVA